MSLFWECSEVATTNLIVLSLSAPGGGEGRAEVGGAPGLNRCGVAHFTRPIPTDQVRGLKAHNATGPLPLPPQTGGEGRALRQLDAP